MKTILIIEDSTDMQELLASILLPTYQLKQAFSGTEGLLLFQQSTVDLVILDRLLPGKSGDDVLTALRENSNTPIIMLTALDDANDIATLLLAGANDYVTKPFNVDELKARIAVQLRQSKQATTPVLTYRQLTLQPTQYNVTNGNQTCSLKRKEFAILQLLFSHPHQIFTREQLYESVWHTPYLGDENTINVHLSNLRTKLAQLDPTHDYIETIWGIGVRLS